MTNTKRISQQLTCLFETGKPELSLNSVENLNDGRGYTCGWAGFTTADEEVVACVEEYTRLVGENDFVRWQLLPEARSDTLLGALERLRFKGSGDTARLNRFSFKTHWQNACSNPKFHEAYATIVDRIFGKPAQTWCAHKGCKLPVAYAIFFDAGIQHGWGDDPDGVPQMCWRTVASFGLHQAKQLSESGLETMFLERFLEVRRQTLLNAHNTETADTWRESVSRVAALEHLLKTNPRFDHDIVPGAEWPGMVIEV